MLACLLAALAGLAWIVVDRAAYPPRFAGPDIAKLAFGENAWLNRVGARIQTLLVLADRGERVQPARYPSWVGAREPVAIGALASVGLREVPVASAKELLDAIVTAEPGDVITLAAGTYRIEGDPFVVQRPGRPDAPITIRAVALGVAVLEVDALEGLQLRAPDWVVENLVLRGVCGEHADCERGLHVTAAAERFVARNNRFVDFNVHVSVTGESGRFPDHGRIDGNTFFDTAPRTTASAVAGIEIVGASDWRIEGNLVTDFAKGSGDVTSYAIVLRGAGERNQVERNAVLCEMRLAGAAGRRIGISFGGAGSAVAECRDPRCIAEQVAGAARANLVAFCSDEGIDVNRAASTAIEHNTLIDTAGIRVRFEQASADVTGNLVDGAIVSRERGTLRAADNRSTSTGWLYLARHPVRDLFVAWDALDLLWRAPPPRRTLATSVPDLCGTSRPTSPTYGAVEDFTRCIDRR